MYLILDSQVEIKIDIFFLKFYVEKKSEKALYHTIDLQSGL